MKHLRVFQRSAIVKLVKGNDIVTIGIGDCKGPDEPRTTASPELDRLALLRQKTGSCKYGNDRGKERSGSYINPFPPVIMMFLTPEAGGNFVISFSVCVLIFAFIPAAGSTT